MRHHRGGCFTITASACEPQPCHAAPMTDHLMAYAAFAAQQIEARGFLGTVGHVAAVTIVVLLAIGFVVGLILGFFIGRAVGRR